MGRLTRHNYAVAADKGTFCQCPDPENGRPMFVENFVPTAGATDPEDGQWVQDPSKPVGFWLLGIDSEAYKKQESKNRDEALDDLRKGVAPNAEKTDDRGTKLLVACTTGWENVPAGWVDNSDNEEPITFSPRAAHIIYSNRGTSWVRFWVDQQIGDRSRFLKA